MKVKKKVALYPGSFDPLTNGHVNVIKRGLETFDEIIVAVANNTSKNAFFTPKERVEIIKELFKKEPRIKVATFKGLVVNYAERNGIKTILRGLRTLQDFENEFQMALTNKKLNNRIETVFMMTEGEFSHLSSTLIKEIVRLGGSPKGMIPPLVEKKLKAKLREK